MRVHLQNLVPYTFKHNAKPWFSVWASGVYTSFSLSSLLHLTRGGFKPSICSLQQSGIPLNLNREKLGFVHGFISWLKSLHGLAGPIEENGSFQTVNRSFKSLPQRRKEEEERCRRPKLEHAMLNRGFSVTLAPNFWPQVSHLYSCWPEFQTSNWSYKRSSSFVNACSLYKAKFCTPRFSKFNVTQ